MTHMAREVAEIPEAAARFLDRARQPLAQAARALRETAPLLLATVARGSSDHAAGYFKYAAELAAGLPVASLGPSVASIYGCRLRLDRAAVLAISQSGQSPDIVAMLKGAAEAGALTVSITNDTASPLAEAAAFCLPLNAGAEKSVAATKTFAVSALAALALLAEWQGDAALKAALAEAPEAFGRALGLDWSALAEPLREARSAFVLGRGPAYPIACEMALKLKETSALHAEAYSAAEVLHGPAAIVGPGFPVLALAAGDAADAQVTTTSERLATQGARVFLTGASAAGSVTLPRLSGLHPLLAPLALIVTFYAFAETLARARERDPDLPPHLSKVTETR
jgi:glucosamine--fructose-6-phosphate aminotransferase (isomerizing)